MLGQKSVLIVEDNGFVALDLSLAVEERGGNVVGPAASVADALVLIDRYLIAGAVLESQLIDRDAAPVVMALIERGVPTILYSGTGWPPSLPARHDVTLLTKPLKPHIVIDRLIDLIQAGDGNDRIGRNLD